MAKRVTFSEADAGRISKTVRAYERGNRDMSPIAFRQVSDGELIRIGKTTSSWAKNTLATITLYESGTPPSETVSAPSVTLPDCVNKFATVASGKWVAVAMAQNGRYYLIAAEC